jgi:NADH dehydrogenase
MRNKTNRIVIIGGGAGGLELATRLGRHTNLTLVDCNLLHVWKPLYHEVAAGTLDSQQDAISFLGQAHRGGFRFEYGRMVGLDRQQRRVELAAMHGPEGNEVVPARSIDYDTLVIAVGSVSNHFGTPGAQEHCQHLDTLEQAEAFQRRLIHTLLRAQASPRPGAKLRIAIVGGGATGVELAAELRSAARRAVIYGLREFDPDRDLQLTVIEAAPRLLPPLAPKLSEKTEQQLHRLGVEVLTNERVAEVTGEGLRTAGGRFIEADIRVWAAGIKAPDFLAGLDLETNLSNQLLVRPTLQTTIDDNIFAFGDCALCPQPNSDRPVPPRAQAAHQQARFLGKALRRHLAGEPLPEFVYHDRGSLISLSDASAVGRLMGGVMGNVMIEGTLARLAYNSLYKQHLAALYGPLRTLVMSLAQLMTQPLKPRLKLH